MARPPETVTVTDTGTLTPQATRRRILTILILTLVIDLLAFTLILPLFPRLIASYLAHDTASAEGADALLPRTLRAIHALRARAPSSSSSPSSAAGQKWDITLLGGLLGSIFSFCQFAVSPVIGRLAHAYGRRPVLLLTLLGNLASNVIWLFSRSYSSFLLSRIVGGLSEGNVQLALLMIADITPPATRSAAMALVGIAFSVAFTLGPTLGAYFASTLPPTTSSSFSGRLNVYAMPALIAIGLLVLEALIILCYLPETKGFVVAPLAKESTQHQNIPAQQPYISLPRRLANLRSLARLHGLFLFFFSGAEFTLTFLTYDLFGFSNGQNGALLGSIGLLTALIMGGYVRRAKVSELRLASQGMQAASAAFVLLALLPWLQAQGMASTAQRTLWLIALLLSFTSATVVSSLNAAASLQCIDSPLERNGERKAGKAEGMARHRSVGQLGRALGPICACTVYWALSPTWCYGALAIAMVSVGRRTQSVLREVQPSKQNKMD